MSPIVSSPDLAADAMLISTLISNPHYARLKEHVLRSTGLAYYTSKDEDLARRLGRRFVATGVRDCGAYLDLLREPRRGPPELDALISEITIGETYFFRHPEHFAALRNQVLVDLISRNRLTRSLRIWCAGCADGPEAYSLSILLKHDFAHRLRGWDVTILGTDIHRQRLACAREGKFEEWALRSVTPEMRDQCFVKQGTCWAIAPEYKEGVSFQYQNLVEDSLPSAVNHLSSFDLIVCRNVMIYFGPDLMQRIIDRFHQCLVPGGWLLVGPSEPNMTSFGSFRAVNAPGVTLYQSPDEAAPAPKALQFTMPVLPAVPVSRPVAYIVNQNGAAQAAPALARTLEDVRALADRGAWEEAARCCEELLTRDRLNARNHFFYGLILEHMRQHVEAEQALKRAIYLEPRSVLAHYYFGLFSQSRGNSLQARRCFENALNLVETRPEDESFPDADGITAGELKKSAAMQLVMLREQI